MPPLFSLVKKPRIGSRGAERWRIFVMIRTRIDEEWLTALATDISLSGIRLKTLNPLRVNQKLWVKLPSADQRLASIVWTEGLVSGCVFAEPIAKNLLDHLRGSPEPGTPIDRREDR
jgi:hypothetical protein